jgi:hypothetical protein
LDTDEVIFSDGRRKRYKTHRRETNMKVTRWMQAALAGALSIGVLASSAATQDKPQESTKQPVRYDASVPREPQIQLALSAAPAEVSSKATIYILGAKGYEKVREGTNGVSCLVERAFVGTTEVAVAPACFDAEGSRTLVLVFLRREELRAQGKSEAEIKADIANGYREGRFKAPGPGFLYMLSSENYIYDPDSKESGFVPGHLMFYAPYMTAKDLGYESVSPTMFPYLVLPGEPDAMIVVAPARKPPQDSSTGDSHKY